MPSANLSAIPLATLLKDLTTSQNERKREQRKLDLMKANEDSIVQEILNREKESFTSGSYKVTIERPKVPFATDWSALIAYIKATGSVDLLEKRLLKSGVQARWADGEDIPGVQEIEKPTLNVEVL